MSEFAKWVSVLGQYKVSSISIQTILRWAVPPPPIVTTNNSIVYLLPSGSEEHEVLLFGSI